MRLLLVLLMCCSCTGAAEGLGLMAFHVATAAAVGHANREAGGCYAACFPGTTCNPKTGYCEALPCHGHCRPAELCLNDGQLNERCEAGAVIPVN